MINTYYPTSELTTRNRDAYFEALADFFENNGQINEHFTVTAVSTDYTIVFVPKNTGDTWAAPSNNLYPRITVASSAVNGLGAGSGSAWVSFSTGANFSLDVPVTVLCSEHGIGILLNFSNFAVYSVAEPIDGGVKRGGIVIAGNQNSWTYWHRSAASGATSITNGYRTVARGQADKFVFTPMIVPDTGLICTGTYIIDGGRGAPPLGPFTFNGQQYYCFQANFAIKL